MYLLHAEYRKKDISNCTRKNVQKRQVFQYDTPPPVSCKIFH
jgi:hypothetical protein